MSFLATISKIMKRTYGQIMTDTDEIAEDIPESKHFQSSVDSSDVQNK